MRKHRDSYYSAIAVKILPNHSTVGRVERDYQWWKAICVTCKFSNRTRQRITTRGCLSMQFTDWFEQMVIEDEVNKILLDKRTRGEIERTKVIKEVAV